MQDDSILLGLSIPGTPVAKGRPIASTVSGRVMMRTPAKTVEYERRVHNMALAALTDRRARKTKGPCALHVRVFLPVAESWAPWKRDAALRHDIRPTARPDIDNYLKAVLDGLNRTVYEDDSQVVEESAKAFYAESPRLDVVVFALDAAPSNLTSQRQFHAMYSQRLALEANA